MTPFSCTCGREVGEPGGCAQCRIQPQEHPANGKTFPESGKTFPSRTTCERAVEMFPVDDQALAALAEIARLRTELSGDFSMASHQSDIARKTLSIIARQCTCHPSEAPEACAHKYALADCLTTVVGNLRAEVTQLRSDLEWADAQRRQNFEWASAAEARAQMAETLRVLAVAHLYRCEGSDDPRALPVMISAPPPARHHNLFALVDGRRPDESGFLLSDGTFADRKRAGEIALANGQSAGLNWGPDLYSEDLW